MKKENIDFYGEENLKKKTRNGSTSPENIFIKGVTAGDIDVTDNKTRDEINATFGDLGAKKLFR